MMTSSKTTSRSLTPTETAETRTATLGLRLSLYATMLGAAAMMSPIAGFLIASIPSVSGEAVRIIGFGLVVMMWIGAATHIVSNLASVLMLGAPQQMRVTRVALLYVGCTAIASLLSAFSVIGLPIGFGFLSLILIFVQYPVWLMYVYRAAHFSNSESAKTMFKTAGGLLCLGFTAWGAVAFQEILSIQFDSMASWVEGLLRGSTVVHLLGMQGFKAHTLLLVTLLFSGLFVIALLLFLSRRTTGVPQFLLRATAKGFGLAACILTVGLSIKNSSITSPFYEWQFVATPLLAIVATIPFMLAPIRAFRGARTTLLALDGVCLNEASDEKTAVVAKPFYKRQPILLSTGMLVLIGSVIVAAYTLKSDSAVQPQAPLTGIESLRKAARQRQEWGPGQQTRLAVGMRVPELNLARVAHGEPIESFEIGKIYVVDFWATWCIPCLDSMPRLSELADRYRDDVVFLGITSEPATVVDSFLKQPAKGAGKNWAESIGYRIGVDNQNAMKNSMFLASGQEGIPCVFIIGKGGLIEWVGHPAEMENVLEAVVADNFDRQRTNRDNAAKLKAARQLATIQKVNQLIWKKVVSPDYVPSVREIDAMKAVCNKFPRGIYFNTLGVLQYRANNYQAAIEACLKSVELTPGELDLPGPHAGDLAFLAMSHFQLGNKDQANQYRQRLAEAMKLEAFKDDEECRGFAKEVEDLFGTIEPKTPSVDDQGTAEPSVEKKTESKELPE